MSILSLQQFNDALLSVTEGVSTQTDVNLLDGELYEQLFSNPLLFELPMPDAYMEQELEEIIESLREIGPDTESVLNQARLSAHRALLRHVQEEIESILGDDMTETFWAEYYEQLLYLKEMYTSSIAVLEEEGF